MLNEVGVNNRTKVWYHHSRFFTLANASQTKISQALCASPAQGREKEPRAKRVSHVRVVISIQS